MADLEISEHADEKDVKEHSKKIRAHDEKKKTELSALELHHVAKELRTLVNSRVDNVYELFPNCFFIRMRSPKAEIIVKLKETVHLTNRRIEAPETPTNFAMVLRKYLKNGILKEVSMEGFERILVLFFEHCKLIIEMFSRGNVLLLDEKDRIIAVYRREEWKDRRLAVKEIYKLPPSRKARDKPNAIHYLSTIKNIGYRYLELLCREAGIEPEASWEKIGKEKQEELIGKLGKIENREIKPSAEGNYYTLFPTEEQERGGKFKRFASVSEMLDYVFQENMKQRKQKEISEEGANEIVKRQIEAGSKFAQEAEGYKKTADAIYSNYAKLHELMEQVKERLKKKEKKEELEKELGIKINGPMIEIEI